MFYKVAYNLEIYKTFSKKKWNVSTVHLKHNEQKLSICLMRKIQLIMSPIIFKGEKIQMDIFLQ